MDETRSNPELVAIGNGALVESDVLGVVTEINRRWPNLRVQYLDPDSSFGVVEAPYQIIETSEKDGREYVVKQVWELTTETIRELEAINTHNVDLDWVINEANRKARLRQDKEWKDSIADANEKAAAVLRSNKDRYSLTDGDKKITFRSNGEHDVK